MKKDRPQWLLQLISAFIQKNRWYVLRKCRANMSTSFSCKDKVSVYSVPNEQPTSTGCENTFVTSMSRVWFKQPTVSKFLSLCAPAEKEFRNFAVIGFPGPFSLVHNVERAVEGYWHNIVFRVRGERFLSRASEFKSSFISHPTEFWVHKQLLLHSNTSIWALKIIFQENSDVFTRDLQSPFSWRPLPPQRPRTSMPGSSTSSSPRARLGALNNPRPCLVLNDVAKEEQVFLKKEVKSVFSWQLWHIVRLNEQAPASSRHSEETRQTVHNGFTWTAKRGKHFC